MKMNRTKKVGKIKKSGYTITFDLIAYIFLTLFAVICILPFILILSGSLTDNSTILHEGYSIIPKNFSLDAYKLILGNPKDMLNAYKVTIFVTAIGTGVGLLLTTVTAYVLSRKEFKYRNRISFIIYFTTIFGGGLIPWYITISKILNLHGTLTALWLPGVLSSYNIILMRTFIKGSVPDEITEAAKIDGAGHISIFGKIVLPVLGPALATIGLFLALGYWNNWMSSSLFINDTSKYMLQFYLYNLLNRAQAIRDLALTSGIVLEVPSESTKLAMTIIVTGPIILLYPFLQKYFVSGITVGAVKG
ncbi:MAG: sugar transporter permease [Anaerocolumna sp.]|jgi:putative aldouronate transport system permease protein|nr:sugar transporter permease [Anaerocolumna sp.]